MPELEGKPCGTADSRPHPHPELAACVRLASLAWDACWEPSLGGHLTTRGQSKGAHTWQS